MTDKYALDLLENAEEAHFISLGKGRALEAIALGTGRVPFTVSHLSDEEIRSKDWTLARTLLIERGSATKGATDDVSLMRSVAEATSRTLFWTICGDRSVRWCCVDDGALEFERDYRFRRSLTGWLPVAGPRGPVTRDDLTGQLARTAKFSGTRCGGCLDEFRALVFSSEEHVGLARGTPPEDWQESIEAMLQSAIGAASRSGAVQRVVHKVKLNDLGSAQEARQLISRLLRAQGYRCKLTGLPLIPHRSASVDQLPFRPSLDRCDSDGHYDEANVQVVCQFVNAWKSDSDQAGFLRLLEAVRSSPGFTSPGGPAASLK
jgi:hypothetical protein